MREEIKEMTLKRRKEMVKKAPEIILRHCRYTTPKLISLEHVLKGDFEDVWVTAMLLPSGKNEWLIRSSKDPEISRHIKKYGRDGVKLLDYQIPEDAEFKYYYNRSVIDLREDRVPLCKSTEAISRYYFSYSLYINIVFNLV